MRAAPFEERLKQEAGTSRGSASTKSRLAQLVDGIKEDAATLARQEAALVKKEVVAAAREVARGSFWVVAGGGVAAMGLVLLLVTLGFALGALVELAGVSRLTSLTLGFGGVALAALLAGGVVVVVSVRRLKAADPTPSHAMRALRYAVKPNLDGPGVRA